MKEIRSFTMLVFWLGSIFSTIAQDSTSADNSFLFSNRSYSVPSILNNDFLSVKRNAVSADFHYFMSSNFASNEVSTYYLLQTNFEGELETSLIENLKEKNTYELSAGGNIMYLHKAEKFPVFGKGTYHIAFTNGNLTTIRSAADAVKFVFNGNAQFENETAVLGPLVSEKFAYNQLRVGLRKDYQKNENETSFGVSLSFIQGFQNWNADLSRGTLFTAEDGEYIDLDYNMILQLGYEGVPNGFEFNGLGFAGDLLLSYKRNNTSLLELQVRDLGWAKWQNEAVTYKADSFIHYQGLEIENFFNIQDSFLTASYIDSLVEGILPDESRTGYNTFFPVMIDLGYSHVLANEQALITAGIRYRNLSGYLPFAYLKANYFITSSASVSASLGYGGYGSYRFGLELAKNWEQFWITFGSNAVEGFIVPSKATSGSIYLNLGTRF